ncbi:MAG: hypothetical protein FWD22_03830 [Treponema sp.]|nr:hypothetical protein [Treponema sp.]
MVKYRILIVIAILTAISCHNPFTFDENRGKGAFSITIGSSGGNNGFRAAWLGEDENGEDITPDILSHRIKIIDKQNNKVIIDENIVYGITKSFSIDPGNYDFLVIARYEGEKKAVGVESRTILSGHNSEVIIEMQSSGDGSDDNPFRVYNAEGLSSIGRGIEGSDFYDWQLSEHYRQITNINLAHFGNWTPIGTIDIFADPPSNAFSGVYDGNGYVISNLKIVNTNDELTAWGLFRVIENGTVRNIGLVDVDITAFSNTGGIAGSLSGGTIENCYVTGSILVSNRSGISLTGGIAGSVFGHITNCWTNVNITATGADVGGIVGALGYFDGNAGYVENCYALGDVTGSSNTGGIVGRLVSGSINNCIAFNILIAVTVTSNYQVGRIVGYIEDDNIPVFFNNYARSDLIPKPLLLDDLDGTDITAAQWHNAYWWIEIEGFNQYIWDIDNERLPILRNAGGQQNPRVASISGTLPDSFRITRSDGLPFTGTVLIYTTLTVIYTGSGSVSYNWRDENENTLGESATYKPLLPDVYKLFITIGTTEITFNFTANEGMGTYDEPFIVYNAETLKRINNPDYEPWTMWSYYRQVDNINLEDEDWTPIGIEDTPFNGHYDGGGFEISNLTINDPDLRYAGLFGYMHFGFVKNLGLVNVKITALTSIGGIVGAKYGGEIENCYVTGSITAGIDHNSRSEAGGIAGFVREGTNLIINCWTDVNITAEGRGVGGIVGYIYRGSLNNCYALGNIIGANWVGGITGVSDGSSVGNSVALNSLVAMTEIPADGPPIILPHVGRIVGLVQTNSVNVTANRARTDLIPKHSYDKTSWEGEEIEINSTTGKDGTNVNADNGGYHSLPFWQSLIIQGVPEWDFSSTGSWQWSTIANLPVLRSMKNTQNPQVKQVQTITELAGNITILQTGTVLSGTALTANYSGTEQVAFQWIFNGNVITNSTGTTYTALIPGAYTVTAFLTGYTSKTSSSVTVSPGTGVEGDPFIVHDVSTMERVGKETSGTNPWLRTSNYKQVRDINMTGRPWTPIGTTSALAFTGEYDGGGFVIRNLRINNADANNQGLFGFINGGKVKNLGLEDVDITAGWSLGGITGNLESGSFIESCYVTGRIESLNHTGTNYNLVGGIVGSNGGVINNCWSDINITAVTQQTAGGVGGIVGSNNGSIQNCYTLGSIFADNEVGGIAGQNGIISSCVALNDSVFMRSTAETRIGRIVGNHSGLNLTNNFAKNEMNVRRGTNEEGTIGNVRTIVPNSNGTDGATVETSQYTNPEWWSTPALEGGPGWDFDTIWEWDEDVELPKLQKPGSN